jgi:foldase protein PrsA
MRTRVRIMVVCCGSALSLLVADSCGSNSNEVVARVGSEAITRAQVDHWTTVAKTLNPAQPKFAASASFVGDLGTAATPKRWALTFLIGAARIRTAAAERGLQVSATETGHALALRERFAQASQLAGGQLQWLLSARHESEADRLWLVSVQLLTAKLGQRLHTQAEEAIPAGDIDAYYEKHKARFVAPELRDVYVVETRSKADVERAKHEVEAGRDLPHVVARWNEPSSAGGRLLGITRRTIGRGYERNYFDAGVYKLVGPLRTGPYYYLFDVSYIAPAHLQSLSEAQSTIRHELSTGPDRHVFAGLATKLESEWQSKTRCAADFTVKQCGAQL